MQTCLSVIAAIFLLFAVVNVNSGPAFAAGDSPAPFGSSGAGNSFSCPVPAEGTDTTCTCSGVVDCNNMSRSGVCKGTGPNGAPVDDTTCNGLGCTCTLQSRARPGFTNRPEAVSPATEVAPAEEGARDRRRRRSTFDTLPDGSSHSIVAPNNRDNEVVPARRGSAPAQEHIIEGDDDEEEEEPTTAPTRRDHRR